MKKLLFVVITLLFLVGSLYVFYSIYPIVSALSTPFKMVYWVIAASMLSAMFVFFAFGKRVPIQLAALLYKIGTGWLMLLIYAAPIALILRGISWLNKNYLHYPIGVLEVQTIAQGAFLLCILLCIAFIGFANYSKKKRVEVRVKTTKSIRQDIKAVFISDLHLGYAIERKELAEWVRKINAEEPDLILIGGDIVDFSLLPVIYYQLGNLLSQLKSHHGVYACMGNHDYMAGSEATIRFMKDSGIEVLRDQSKFLPELGVTLIGRDDLTNRNRKTLAQVRENVLDDSFMILLDHQPYHLEEAVANKMDIQLSGHTHRGQVWPISYITDRLFENSHGYLKKEDTSIYVSSGIGIWGGRYRIGTQSEYLVLKIEK